MKKRQVSIAVCSGTIVLFACGASQPLAPVQRPIPVQAATTGGKSSASRAMQLDSTVRYALREPNPGSMTGVHRPQPMAMFEGIYGPGHTNFPVRSNVRLSKDALGLLDHGRRFVLTGERLSPADNAGCKTQLEGFVAVPEYFGGGFVFFGRNMACFAERFDAPLRQLGDIATTDFDIGPRCILISDERGTGQLVALRDGKSLPNAPSDLLHLWAHRSGFMIAATRGATKAGTSVYFTSDARTWRRLPVKDIRGAYEDGDALVLTVPGSEQPRVGDRVYRVSRDGKLSTVSKDAAVDVARKWGDFIDQQLGGLMSPPTEAPPDGALMNWGWVPSMRVPDEWFLAVSSHLYRTRTGTRDFKAWGLNIAPENSCGAAVLSGQTSVVCMDLGAHLRIFRADLDTGDLTLERDIAVTKGVARQMGTARVWYPRALFITASCDGDAEAGVCVRGRDGSYQTHDFPAPDSSYIFPGEVIQIKRDGSGGIELWGASSEKRCAFDAKQMKEASTALGWDLAAKPGAERHESLESIAFIEAGALRTATSLRQFYIPNPLVPLPKSPVSYALDLPLNCDSGPRLISTTGVVAAAGIHGLRLDNGKLYETSDGWATWHEVIPPPSGVPADLGGAECDESAGCLFGPWARIGWQQPAAN